MLQFIVLAFVLLLGILFFYRLTRPSSEPNFQLKGAVPEDKLSFLVTALASKSKKPFGRGNDLSLVLIKKHLNAAYKVVALKAAAGEECQEFEHWIYDNYYKLIETVRLLKKHKNVFFRLPHVTESPRIYELAELIVKSSEGFVTDELLEKAVGTYNLEAPLTFGEVQAIKLALYYALMEYVAIFCAKCVKINKMIALGLADAKTKNPNFKYLRYNSYVYGYSLACDGEDKRRINELCLDNGSDLYARIDNFFYTVAKYNGFMQSAVTTVHRIPYWFTDEFTLKLSPLYDLLSGSKAVNFDCLTSATKHLYFFHIAAQAKRHKQSESAFAREVLIRAEGENRDAVFYLIPPPHGKKTAAVFILSVPALAAVFAVFFAYFTRDIMAFYLVFGIPIFVQLAYVFIMEALRNGVKSRQLPACDLKTVSPERCSTLITVPRLVASTAEIEDAFANLETLVYANYDAVFSYCLLLDFSPSEKNETEEYDESFYSAIKTAYESLREKNRITVLVRKRVKVEGEQKYQGWEKKRGALLQLNDCIINGKTDVFSLICGKVPMTEFVITLDSDTLLNSCRSLVEIMLHPYNRDKSVVSIQMKINPSDACASGFTRLFSGGRGLNNYSNYLCETENDLFGCGNYTGKGIYRVQDFQAKVSEAFPENRILSHDYLEGAYAGCAASNVYALDGFPKTYSKFLTRDLRWMRGDWQLMPYLLPKVKDQKGEQVKNPVPAVGKWHIFYNMLFSLVPIMSVILLYFSLFRPQAMLPIVLLSLALPGLRCLFALRSLFFRPKLFFAELLRQLFYVGLLPVVAVYSFISVAVTVGRIVRGKKLLEWQVFAHSGSNITFLPCVVAAIIFTATALVFGLSWFYYLLSSVFLFGFLLNRLLSLPARREKEKDAALTLQLMAIAKDTFAYFRAQLVQDNHFLPCDNFQEHNNRGWMRRTSPTNIGMFLLGYFSAYELKLIQKAELNEAVTKIISSVELLEKWHGNLYNWYDVSNLKVLSPRYVSSVDSGNFLACLLAAAAYTEGELKERIYKLIELTELGALYDGKRGLFYTGYNDSSASFDTSHYDLLGSESALTYLVAVGAHKTGKEAWDNLSRSMVRLKGASFCSWTGGMFEYLMSNLFFRFSDDTTVYRSSLNAVRSQIAYADKRGYRVWGISESQYSAEDDNGGYLYRAFGVPELAQSNISDSTVIAPYAGLLALPYAPQKVHENLGRLSDEGAYGRYGLYESVDLAGNRVMKTYMTHHQGMILAAIANYAADEGITRGLQILPQMRAAALLLTESEYPKAHKKQKPTLPLKSSPVLPLTVSAKTQTPFVNLLTNGRYHVVTDSRGGGYSLFDGCLLTRFHGFGKGVKLCAEVNGKKLKLLDGKFTANQITTDYENHNSLLTTKCEVSVLPMLDGQAVQTEIVNLTENVLTAKLSALAELALNEFSADLSHPAYSKMFIETGYEREGRFVWARRTGNTKFFVGMCVLTAEEVGYETDRANYYGRAHSAQSFGKTLDPVFGATFELKLLPRQKNEFTVCLLCAQNFERLKYVMKLAAAPGFLERGKGNAYALSRYRNIGQGTKLAAAKLLYVNGGSMHGKIADLALNYTRPTVVLNVESTNGIERLSRKLQELKALYPFNIAFNLVILYREKYNYYLHLTDRIQCAVRDSGIQKALNGDSTLHIINCTDNPRLKEQLNNCAAEIETIDGQEIADFAPLKKLPNYPNAAIVPFEITRPLGLGGFTEGGAYAMNLTNCDTPVPWSNVIAGPSFGTIITESGGGYTFADNARETKLTVWRNDPVLDAPSEFVVLGEKNVLWSVTKKPMPATKSDYYALHSFGYSEFRNNYNGIAATEKITINHNGETKYYDLTLENATEDLREVDALFGIEAVLGDFAVLTKTALKFTKTSENTVKITNTIKNFSAYLHSSRPIASLSYHKEAFMDEDGRVRKTCDLKDEGTTPFLAVSCKIRLTPKQTERIVFSLGTEEEADLLHAQDYLRAAHAYFSNLSPVIMAGEDDLALLYKWLPYQVLCSRFYGRTGYYQSSGAFGFRDQLQDCLALMYFNPKLAREHILTCAAHQFEKGDVQHWWHVPAIGVRTRFCDDRMFLPYLTAEYIRFTHDYDFMAERVPFLSEVTMTPDDVSVYASPAPTPHRASILEHCLRAIEVSCDFGENGLVLMRGGDWNDAMDCVGEKGYGTSVWASMFLYHVLKKFLPFVNDAALREKYQAVCESLFSAVSRAFENDRFLRAFADDGAVLGSVNSKACKIDLLVQSWAELAEIGEAEQRRIGLNTAFDKLVDRENKIIKLLDPPFSHEKKIGYIGDYPPGVRENGGQYTHAAIWFIMALFKSGKVNDAYGLLRMINPIEHCQNLEGVGTYRGEPYVIAADVYSGEKAGRAGWTWYTGSAAWLYKCITESLLGIRFEGKAIRFAPKLPRDVASIPLKIKTEFGLLDVEIQNSAKDAPWRVKIGTVQYNTDSLILSAALIGKKVVVFK